MTVRAGAESAFQDTWLKVAETVSRHPGCLRQALLCDDQHPRTFVVTSDWDSREALHAFQQVRERDRITEPLNALRESAQMTVDEILYHT